MAPYSQFSIKGCPNSAFVNGLHISVIFIGPIINRENIGKTSDNLFAKWNEAYAEDQVVFSSN
jgi:hypothetical protein